MQLEKKVASGFLGKFAKRIAPLIVIAGMTGCPSPAPTPTPTPTPAKNHAPVITSSPSWAVNEGENYNYLITAKDEDGDALTITVTKNPDWLPFDTEKIALSGTAPAVDVDAFYEVAFQVSDGKDSVTQDFFIRDKDLETRTAITNAADRLVALQNSNGSWDWIVTDKTGPTSTTYLNIAGVTAEGVLDAYKLTGDTKYLDAAKKTGDFLISNYGIDGSNATNFGGSGRINSANVKFLYKLGKAVSEDNNYKTLADILMNKVIAEYPTGIDLLNKGITYRGTANGEGIIPWDLYPYIEDAAYAGNTDWANSLADAIKDNSPLNLSDNSDITYVIGLTGMSIAGNADASLKLKAIQGTDGSWVDPNGQIQDTAYSLMAMKKAGYKSAADNAVKYLKSSFGYSGVNGWKETDANEYSEVNSEAVQALTQYIDIQ